MKTKILHLTGVVLMWFPIIFVLGILVLQWGLVPVFGVIGFVLLGAAFVSMGFRLLEK